MADDSNFTRLRDLAASNPDEFRRLMESVAKTVVHPHAAQKVVLDSKARFRVLNCGRRWGKTMLAAKIVVGKTRKPKQMIWWVAPTYRVVKRGYAEVLRQLPDGVLAHEPPPDTTFDAGRPAILRFKNGTRLEFYSAERPEGMLGAAVDFAVLDEAAIMPGRIWNQIISPTLIDHKGLALMISTPRGRNWFYEAWLKGQDPSQTEWASWTFTTQDNPTLPPGEADRMAADMPRMEADQEIFAKWLAAGSSVFILEPTAIQHAIVRDDHVIDGVKIKGGVFLGVDLARTNDYTVLYGTVEQTRQNCYFERLHAIAWNEQRRRIRRAVRTLLKAGAEHVTLMVDEGNAGSVIVEDLEEMGYDVVGVNFTTTKPQMVRLLANDLEMGRAFVLDEGLVEFENYTMAVTPAGRFTYSAPEGQHDDIVSAKMLSHWGCVNEGFGNVSMISPEAAPFADSDPIDADDEFEDYSDLLDDDAEPDLSFDQAMVAIGRQEHLPGYVPTPQELLTRPDLWF